MGVCVLSTTTQSSRYRGVPAIIYPLTYPVVAPLPQVVHEEPEHVAIKEVSVLQAVLVPLPLVLLDHL